MARIMVGFEPVKSQALLAEARRARSVGVVAAVVLVLLGLALFRILKQRAALRRRLARERHLAALGEMASVLAHELRNPLASLKGHAQLLKEMLPEAERTHKKAQRVVAEAIRLEELTNDLLDFARSGAPDRRNSDPTALLAEAADAVAPGGITLETDLAPARWSLDPLRFRQVLENLLRNAIQATPDGAAPPKPY